MLVKRDMSCSLKVNNGEVNNFMITVGKFYVLLMFRREAGSKIFANSFSNIVIHLTVQPESHHL
jgi:hypothetical protein